MFLPSRIRELKLGIYNSSMVVVVSHILSSCCENWPVCVSLFHSTFLTEDSVLSPGAVQSLPSKSLKTNRDDKCVLDESRSAVWKGYGVGMWRCSGAMVSNV